MADVTFTPASYNQAYRAYATEQGNDPELGKIKAAEVANQTASVSGGRSEYISDSVYISPAAAQLYAESMKQLKTVTRRTEVQSRTARGTTARTHKHQDELAEVMNIHHEEWRPANPAPESEPDDGEEDSTRS